MCTLVKYYANDAQRERGKIDENGSLVTSLCTVIQSVA